MREKWKIRQVSAAISLLLTVLFLLGYLVNVDRKLALRQPALAPFNIAAVSDVVADDTSYNISLKKVGYELDEAQMTLIRDLKGSKQTNIEGKRLKSTEEIQSFLVKNDAETNSSSWALPYGLNYLSYVHQAAYYDVIEDIQLLVRQIRSDVIKESLLEDGALRKDSPPIKAKMPFNEKYSSPCISKRQTNVYESTRSETTALSCLPHFFLAGFPKCGTTDLYESLLYHPSIVGGVKKEPHWWTRPNMRNMAEYQGYFAQAASKINLEHNLLTVDGSASTFWDNRLWQQDPVNRGSVEPVKIVAHHIKDTLPLAKFIVILRNPTERLFSDYVYFSNQGPRPQKRFHKAAVESVKAILKCFRMFSMRYCAYTPQMITTKKMLRIWIGFYYIYIKDWLDVFSSDQVLVLKTDDYAKNKLQVLNQIAHFLHLKSFPESAASQLVNRPHSKPSPTRTYMWRATEELLDTFYAPFNQKLAKLLNNETYLWNTPTPSIS